MLKILLVDSVSKVRKITKNILNQLGFNYIIEANNGLEAIELLKKHKIDLIITDWHLKKLNGIELTKFVRKHPDFSHIPVVMISAEALDENVKKAKDAGVNCYIVKPFSKETLLKKLNNIIGSNE